MGRGLLWITLLAGCGRLGFDASGGDPDAAGASTLSITTPAAGAEVEGTVTLSGGCDTILPIELSGAGLASPSNTSCSANAFSVEIVFTAGDGVKTIVVTQTDRAGQTTSVTRNFLRVTIPPPMITYRSSANGTSASLGVGVDCELAIAKPPGAVDGDLMLGMIYTDGGSGSSVGTPAGWTRLNLQGDVYVAFYKIASGDDASSFGFAIVAGSLGGTCESGGVISAFANVKASAPIDVQSANTGANVTIIAPFVTASDATMLVAVFGANGPATGIVPPTGMTTDASSRAASVGDWGSALIAWEPLATSGPTSERIATIATARNNAASLIVLRRAP